MYLGFLLVNSWEIWMFVSLFFCVILFVICSFFSTMEELSDSQSPFECGMESIKESRVPLSMQFFSIVFLFLVFDVELIIILPMIFLICSDFLFLLNWFYIFLILLLGLMLEVVWNSVDWKN